MGINAANTQSYYLEALKNQQPQSNFRLANSYVNTPVFNNNVQQPAVDSFNNKTLTTADGKDDGSIGFVKAAGNLFKGVGNFFKGMFCDESGKFSLSRTLTTIGIGAAIGVACAFLPTIAVAGMTFSTLGLISAGFGAIAAYHVGDAAIDIMSAKTDAEAEQGWQNLGSGLTEGGLAYLGYRASGGIMAKDVVAPTPSGSTPKTPKAPKATTEEAPVEPTRTSAPKAETPIEEPVVETPKTESVSSKKPVEAEVKFDKVKFKEEIDNMDLNELQQLLHENHQREQELLAKRLNGTISDSEKIESSALFEKIMIIRRSINKTKSQGKNVSSNENVVVTEPRTLQESIADYKSSVKSENVQTCSQIDEMLNSLVEHNYSNDESVVGIMTRTADVDYHGQAIDIKGNEIIQRRLVRTGENGVKQAPDSKGNYLIQTLDDGRRLVSIVVDSGRNDYCGRGIRSRLTIVSKDNEFTPMQKDLIKIISQRMNKTTNEPDILSIGAIAYDYAPIKLNKDVLLSSIATALKQIKPEEINMEFVNRALSGETIAKCEVA